MKKRIKQFGLLCLLLCLSVIVKAQGNITATWDFQNRIPASLSEVALQGNTGYVVSDVEGVSLYVDATNGKFNVKDRSTDVQVNSGTIVHIPVKNMGDVVSVTSYPNYHGFTLGGIAADADVTEYKAKQADATNGYVEFVATNTTYLYKIQVTFVSKIQEKSLYKTDFSEWTAASAATSESTVAWKTKYSGEDLTFKLYNTAILNVTDTKFANTVGVPHMALQAAKAADPYVETSALKNISKVRFLHGATGGNRGWKLEVKGDGDTDWVTISDAVANPAGGQDVTCNVNRTNCQLRFTNLTSNQNAYMFELEIFGEVDLSQAPILGSFKLNGTEYIAGEIFEDVDDTKATATIHISRNDTQISETNPLTDITVDNGELGTVSYNVDGTTTIVAIPVTFGSQTKNYELTVDLLPMINVNYINTDGTAIGKQQIEQYSKISEFVYGESDVTVEAGKKFRGWFASATGGRKMTVDEVIETELNIYAVATVVETTESKASHYFNLKDQYFYAEDHEAFNPTGGEWHDASHGWIFQAGNSIDILVSGNADILLGTCLYSKDGTITVGTAGTVPAKATVDGQLQTVHYEGAPGTVTITFDGQIYLHTLAIINEGSVTNGYYIVEKDNAADFLTALNIANSTSAGNGYKIFLPDGTYDLGENVLNTVSANNISIIGQSMTGTIIKNAPLVKNEGIGSTATIYNTSSNLYLQDLTLQNALDYYGSGAAGRAVCLQDKGANTIAKNVRMLSYQDTYYSNNESNFYWEDSEIHGTVDYLCGGGDVVYNRCKFVNESRSATTRSGDCTIAAPNPSGTPKWGYVMLDCNIVTNSASFNFGRSWGGKSTLVYIRTTIEEPSRLALSRFTVGGMNNAAYKFKEYKTMDADGNVISPATNVIEFTHSSGNNEIETILTDEEAATYTVENMFGTWAPDAKAAQLTMGSVSTSDGTLSWDAVEGSTAYAIFNDGEFVTITDATTYSVTEGDASKYSVRAANGRGGFGPAAGYTSGISNTVVEDGEVAGTAYYNLQGVRVSDSYNGVVIKVNTMKDGRKVASKVIK